MSTNDISGAVPPQLPSSPTQPPVVASFANGRQRIIADDLGRIAIRGGFLTLITLSIYRFWMKTTQRQLIWRETRIGDDGFEYTGTALELLIGSMIAIVFLAVWLGVANLGMAYLQLAAWQDFETSFMLAPLLASPLIAFAVYRARRYKMLRTRWRGIRCGMDGSGVAYAMRWLFWTAIQLATLGLATPWKAMALEGYMTRHMMYGSAHFTYQPRKGALWRLFLNFLVPWVPLAALAGWIGWLHYTGNEDFAAFIDVMSSEAAREAEDEDRSEIAVATQMFIALAAVPLLLAYPLYLRYKAREIAERISSRRLGKLRFECDLTWGATLRPVLAWLGRYIVMSIPVLMLSGLAIALGALVAVLMSGIDMGEIFAAIESGPDEMPKPENASPFNMIPLGLGLYASYGIFIIFMMWLSSVVYFRRRHTFICRGTVVHGLDHIADVEQRARAEQMESEGFADALDVGGI